MPKYHRCNPSAKIDSSHPKSSKHLSSVSDRLAAVFAICDGGNLNDKRRRRGRTTDGRTVGCPCPSSPPHDTTDGWAAAHSVGLLWPTHKLCPQILVDLTLPRMCSYRMLDPSAIPCLDCVFVYSRYPSAVADVICMHGLRSARGSVGLQACLADF